MLLSQLAKNLEEQTLLHSTLLELLEQEAELSAKTSLKKLHEMQKAKENVFDKIKNIETLRQKIVFSYSQESDKNEGISLKEIIAQCGVKKIGEQLSRCHQKLVSVVEKIQEMAYLNALKAKARARSLWETQNEIHKFVPEQQSSYSFRGEKTQPQRNYLLKRCV